MKLHVTQMHNALLDTPYRVHRQADTSSTSPRLNENTFETGGRTDDPDTPASLKEDRRPSELSDLAREPGRVIALNT